jgi:hypothetical protein
MILEALRAGLERGLRSAPLVATELHVRNLEQVRPVPAALSDSAFYSKEARDSATIVLQLMREQVEENHRQRMAELAFQREADERQKLAAMLPEIIASSPIADGRPIIPDGMADEGILEAAAQTLREMPKKDRLRAIDTFPKALRAIVRSRLTKLTKRRRR